MHYKQGWHSSLKTVSSHGMAALATEQRFLLLELRESNKRNIVKEGALILLCGPGGVISFAIVICTDGYSGDISCNVRMKKGMRRAALR